MTALWQPCTQMQLLHENPPLSVVRGKGAYLYDAQNTPYLDAISSWWVNLHGHCHPQINHAISKQLETLEHTLLASVTHPSIVSLAQELVDLAPPQLTKAFFADSGSAAVECALKMSLQFWHQTGFQDKTTFVSLEHGYHGETLGSLAVTDIPLFRKQFQPLLINHIRVSSPADIFCSNDVTQEIHEANCLNEIEQLFIAKNEQICAFICEPLVQGACGMGMYSASYLTRVKTLCQRYNIHFIADEIAVGFGRTGTMFACEQANISPDFMCLSKGLTAGYLPMSCVLTSDKIFSAFLDSNPKTGLAKGFLHSHSFTGNPLAASAALASLKLFRQENILEHNQALIRHIQTKLGTLEKNPFITQTRQTGMIAAFTIDAPENFGYKLHIAARKAGILVRPIGNHVYFMPPYCITINEIDVFFDTMSSLIETLVNGNHDSVMHEGIDPKLLA